MFELPYYCHVCDRVVYIENEVVCPRCKEAFLEVYDEESEYAQEHALVEEYGRGRRGMIQTILGMFDRPKKPKSIAADRRNYAIGPEIHDIITRLMEEKQIEEKPATEEQKARLINTSPPEGETCMICLNIFEQEEAVMYPCTHFFHHICSDAWTKMQSECPLCRKSL